MPLPLEAVDLQHELPLGDVRVQILHGVSLRVEPGEWLAIVGPSGSGKSTLLGLLCGLEVPTRGVVRLGGEDVTHMDEKSLARLRGRHVGIVFQSFNLIPTLTALENVEVPLYVRPERREARARATELLRRVGLGDRLHHRPHQLSGGQQQRVAIARALVGRPAVLVADEPTGNLDSHASADVLDLLGALRTDTGTAIVVVTHDPLVAARADRVLHLVDGRFVDAPEALPETTP